MKKRLFSLIVALFVLFTATTAFAENALNLGNIVSRLGEYGKEDRDVLGTLSRSLLGVNSGVKMLRSMIKNYDGDTSDTTNKVIGRLLNVYSKEELLAFLDKLVVIEQKTRYDFFTDLINRNGIALTDEQIAAVDDMCSMYLADNYAEFQRICTEDAIDEGVIAKLLSVGNKLNGYNPVYIDGEEKNTLAYNDLTDQYLAFAALKQDTGLDEALAKINSSPRLVKDIMTIGDATGLYQGQGYIEDEPEPNTGNTGEPGGPDGGNTIPDGGNTTPDGGNTTPDGGSTTPDGGNTTPGGGGSTTPGGGNDNRVFDDDAPDDTDDSGINNSVVNDGQTTADGNDKAQNAAFADIANHWSKDYVTSMADKGIFKGYEDNTFRPDNALTRQEMAVTMVRVLGIEDELGTAENPAFSDDDKIAGWAKDYVYLLVSRGIFAGYADGSFGPGDLLTREQFALVMSRISGELIADDFELGFADNNKISDWAKDAVRAMAYLGIITGYEDNTFRPANSLTRAEACTMIYRYLNK